MELADLQQLNEQIAGCHACRLSEGRTQTVPGDGDTNAELMFIGEGPGFHEDRQGRPFVGQAGKLLDDLLAGIGLSRAEVFVANVVKCRPPQNRDPQPDEISACEPYLSEQIAGIRPKLIVPLGRFATQYFIPRATMGALARGGRAGRAVADLPVYHPAAALRQGLAAGGAARRLRAHSAAVGGVGASVRGGGFSRRRRTARHPNGAALTCSDAHEYNGGSPAAGSGGGA